MIRFQAQLAEAAQIAAEFRFLNDFAPIVVGGGDGGAGLFALNEALNSSPSGGTPLCAHVAAVEQKIRAAESALRASGQVAVVVLATDGESSDGDVVAALRKLASLPCWVTVRLCTEDEAVDRYWDQVPLMYFRESHQHGLHPCCPTGGFTAEGIENR
jgi:hypothetical protein